MGSNLAFLTDPVPDVTPPYKVFREPAARSAQSGEVQENLLPSRILYQTAVIVQVSSIPESTVRVKEPFFVRIKAVDDQFLAASLVSEIYELGETRGEALRNYLDALVEHFSWLKENRNGHITEEERDKALKEG